jgi:methionine-rich copper-binding protein CopC
MIGIERYHPDRPRQRSPVKIPPSDAGHGGDPNVKEEQMQSPAIRWSVLAATAALSLAMLILAAPAVFAHAILLESTPAPKTTVGGPDVDIRLRFNSRVDGERSHLALALPDGKERALTLAPQAKPDVLAAKAAGLTPGAYKVRWQVLAADGHITRGEVPFQVK